MVRDAVPGDVAGLRCLYDGLRDEDRHRRFFSSYRPDRAFLEGLVDAPRRGGCQLVAVEEPGGTLVGEAGYVLLPNGDGELAITVARDARGWLGPWLLDALLEAAAAAGVPNLEADVLVTNRPMLELLRSRGTAMMQHEDVSAIRLLVGTGGRAPSWPGRHDRPRVLVETPGGRWHAEDAAVAAGMDVLACPGPRRRAETPARCPALQGEPCPLVQGADAVVISRPPPEERWQALHEAHARLHPDVPVCIEVLGAGVGTSDVTGDTVQDESRAVVGLVSRLARRRAPEDPT